MSILPSIEQLQKDITSARTDLTRLETQQEGSAAEITKMEAEVQGLGIEPDNLTKEVARIREDVNTAVKAVQAEMRALEEEVPSDE